MSEHASESMSEAGGSDPSWLVVEDGLLPASDYLIYQNIPTLLHVEDR